MTFPPLFEVKLGFDLIRQMLNGYCLSPAGRKYVDQIFFSTDPEEIATMLSVTSEMRQILEFEEHFPSQDYYDMVPELIRIRIPGTYMETEQLAELRLSLVTITDLSGFLTRRHQKYPFLNLLMEETATHFATWILDSGSGIIDQINRILNEKSEIRDTASPELHRIRREIAAKQAMVERQVEQSFKLARQSGWTPEDADITIRNGRLVIPMISAHKRKIQGFVHDESSTGHTVYIEPAGIFETNNEIRELGYAERREIIRILTAFTDSIRPETDILIHAYQFLGKIDFIRAKGLLAIETGGRKPMACELPATGAEKVKTGNPPSLSGSREVGPGQMGDEGWTMEEKYTPSLVVSRESASQRMLWRGAVHPLLLLSHRRQGKTVVPLDIELNPEQRILVISGPNAGGKSVCLKTVGLLQYMYQCGLLPPVKEDSEFLIFGKIFIDIGDEQSIDNDLSTYTSKLYNLKHFIEHVDGRTLFLIDELGTGTDPSLGGAIAEATLETLNTQKAYGVVTTHYSNLKLLAGREEGIVNGAMLFDLKKLKPLFKLKTGKPGSSFAFEIAREIGFPDPVLKRARKKTGKSQLNFDRELQNLEVEKQEISQKSTELRVADDFLAELIRKYEKLAADLESKKREILEKARSEARELLDNSNKIIEKTIREIREVQAEKAKTKELREEFVAEKHKLMGTGNTPLAPPALIKTKGSPRDPESGKSPTEQKRSDLPSRVAPPPSPGEIPRNSPYHSYLAGLQNKLETFSLTLDIRGMRVEETFPVLERYIDDAILLSISEVRILHGKGNGILRQVTREYLRTRKEVKTSRDASPETGGSGITEVTFK